MAALERLQLSTVLYNSMATVIGPTPGTIQVQIGLENMNVTKIKLSYVSRKTHKNIAVWKYVIFWHKVHTTIQKENRQ